MIISRNEKARVERGRMRVGYLRNVMAGPRVRLRRPEDKLPIPAIHESR
jgi:hypothetical protein